MAVSREPVTTTHDPEHGGRPRLVVAQVPDSVTHETPGEIDLTDDAMVIGSAAGCDIRLDGLEAEHALVRHDEQDEYVLEQLSRSEPTLVNGERVERALLRTASRLELGGWTLTFYREEYADHGRPYGGRVGGEAGHQQAQPARDGASGHWTDDPDVA